MTELTEKSETLVLEEWGRWSCGKVQSQGNRPQGKWGGGVYSNGEMGPSGVNTLEWRGRRRVGGWGGGWGAWCTAVAMGVGCIAECAVVVYGVRGKFIWIKGNLAAAIKCLHTFLGKMCRSIDVQQARLSRWYGKSIIQSRENIIIHEVDKNGLLFDIGSVDASGPPGWQWSGFNWDGTAIDQLDGLLVCIVQW
ncbi:hypothetical protein BU17DRAFT_65040 [Hysterangium stoloniferum]|nr:hypothetical protein BU17DRAFT_65040 [Hysterangium stoloniferum]